MFKLKTGMVVKFCDGKMGIVVNDYIYLMGGFIEINDCSLFKEN